MEEQSDLPFGGRTLVIDADLPPRLMSMLENHGIKAELTQHRNIPPASESFGAITQPDPLIAKAAAESGDIVVTKNWRDIKKVQTGFGRADATVIAVKGLVAEDNVRLCQELINLGQRFRILPTVYAPGTKWILSNEGLREVKIK